MEDLFYLTAEHIYLIHSQTIKEFGGLPGYYDFTDGRIESILSQQFPVFAVDKYPNVFQKAAMLLYFFTKGHCFRDGNKRVGVQTAIVFLSVNGYEDNLPDLEGHEKTIEVAASELTEEERDNYIQSLALWLSKRFYKLDD